MNIVVLSDLNWLPHMLSIDMDEVQRLDLENIAIPRYERIHRYLEIIRNENADLVLFAGDVTGDGSCGHGFHFSFIALLKMLEYYSIPSAYISGNHDEDDYYNQLTTYLPDLPSTRDISNDVFDFEGLRILGISYDTSSSKTKLTDFISQYVDQQFDIVCAHSSLNRRIRLFELSTDYIVTGHYDRKLMTFENSIFISLDNDSEEVSYAVIHKNNEARDYIEFKIIGPNVALCLKEYTDQLSKNERSNQLDINNASNAIDLAKLETTDDENLYSSDYDYSYLKYLRGNAYHNLLTKMWACKHKEVDINEGVPLSEFMGLSLTPQYQVSESLIEDYLGNVL